MKQHITIKQLNELSEKEQLELLDWEKSKGYAPKDHARSEALEPVCLLKEPTIGQMIEFLDEYMTEEHWRESLCFDRGEHLWRVYSVSFDVENNKFGRDSKQSVELCDALWEAVKEILKK